MAEYMTSVNIDTYDSIKRNIAWEYDSGDVSSSGNGDAVIIPIGVKQIVVSLEIDTGEGKIQTTTNKVTDVISDTDVVWVDWDDGSVTSTTQDSCSPVTAIRMINTLGTTRMMLRAQ